MGNMKAIGVTLAALALSGMAFGTEAANAGSLEPAGWTVGIALGVPLPEGVYFIDNASIGGWRGVDDSKSSLAINIPLIAWFTPWTLPGGGRIEFLGAWPEISGGIPQLPPIGDPSWAGRDYTQFYNPVGFIGAAWDLGGGFAFSAFVGGWAPMDNEFEAVRLRQLGAERARQPRLWRRWLETRREPRVRPAGNTQVNTILGAGQTARLRQL